MGYDDAGDTELVRAARDGHDASFALLVDRWLDRCWEVAWRILRDRDLAADIAQETMVTAWQQLPTLEQDGSFGGWVLRIARNRALNRLERERRAVPTGDEAALEPTDRLVAVAEPGARVERAEQAELLWAAASALGERDASVLDLHLRHGLGPAELADELGVTANNAHQLLFRLRNRLGGAIRAHVLWHGGEPRCDGLAEVLRQAGITTFGPAAVKAIERHATGCAACDEERAAVLAPAALFAAVPVVAMPADLRTRLVASLADAGVPTSAAGSAPPSTGPTGPTGSEAPGDGSRAGGEQGGRATADGGAAPGPAPAGPRSRATDRRRYLVAAAVLAAMLAVAALVALDPGRPEQTELAVVDRTTTTTLPATGTTASTLVASPPAPPASIPTATTAATGPQVPAPPTTAPPAPPPTTAPPTVTSPPPTTTTTEAPTTTVPAPTIVHFTPTRLEGIPGGPSPSGDCESYESAHRLAWRTEHADRVALAIAGGPPAEVDPVGELVVCDAEGLTATLTAFGADGTEPVSQTVDLD